MTAPYSERAYDSGAKRQIVTTRLVAGYIGGAGLRGRLRRRRAAQCQQDADQIDDCQARTHRRRPQAVPGFAFRPGAASWPPRGKDARSSSRSEEHTSELQSLMRISYAVFCLNKK